MSSSSLVLQMGVPDPRAVELSRNQNQCKRIPIMLSQVHWGRRELGATGTANFNIKGRYW